MTVAFLLLTTSFLAAQEKDPIAPEPVVSFSVTPEKISLKGLRDRQQLLATANPDSPIDVTRRVNWTVEPADVAAVNSLGVVTPLRDGDATVTASVDGKTVAVAVHVSGTDAKSQIDFDQDVQAVLTRWGCNQGACHGKQRGQNGFQLSLLGFDSNFDYEALVMEARGRRVFPAAPTRSLLLEKPTGQTPHGGGKLFQPESEGYQILKEWIEAGLPRKTDVPRFERITVFPEKRTLKNNAEQQLQVTAHYSDGSTRDVTHLAAFQSSESAIVGVSEEGLIKAGPITGDAAIMARFLGQIAICHVDIPLPGAVEDQFYASLPVNNFIDKHVWEKLKRLRLTPSAPADDATFLRRVYLDVIGRLPTPEETRKFLADASPEKRSQVVDQLLERPEYADFWANKWVDLLRPNPYRVGIKAVFNLDAWIRDAFRKNMPYDQFVREIVAAQGSTFDENTPVTVFRDRRDPDEITTMVSQLFLGIRLDCAKCHHHPFEVWGQDDFYSFAAYFSRLGRKGTGLSPPISGSEEIVFASKSGAVRHPLTGQVMEPRPLFGEAPQVADAEADLRRQLAEWITSDSNHYFAQVAVNRVWADLMGRGIVDPVDDLRGTNPPSNAELLNALAEDFRNQRYDLKKLLKTITSSYVYALSADPNERNVMDTRNYSRHYRQRLRAETLLDAVCDITGVPESFAAMPPGSRATELWTHRSSSLFLDTFGRPDPNQDPPCERLDESSVVQALHLMNAPNLHEKVTSNKGRAAQLAASDWEPNRIIDELYLLTYSRLPSDEERSIAESLYSDGKRNRRQATEDLLWALMNTPEFIFKN